MNKSEKFFGEGDHCYPGLYS